MWFFVAFAVHGLGCGGSEPVVPPPSVVVAPAAAMGAVTGTIAETMDAGGYTYVRLQTEAYGEIWAAIPQTSVTVGAPITIEQPNLMTDFESKTLHRTFDKILFGNVAGAKAALPAAAPVAAGGSPSAPVASGPISVPKAEGADGHTIAEVYAKKGALADGSVSVRGRVMKATNGVMGKNWLHLQDGSGAAADGDHDLTVTTDALVELGSTVLVQGKLHTDKDFGAGYSYAVIVEDAAVVR